MKAILTTFIISFILLSVSASAATYYVSRADGNDSYNGLYPTYQGGSDGPWLTLAKSVDSVSSGDTVYLRGGTWQDEQLYIGYKNYNSTTTWKAYPGETPVIDMRNSGTTEATAPGIFCKGTDYVYIDGITVRNSGHDAIRFQGCDHTKVINCTTEHSRRAGIYMVVLDDFEVAYNTVKWTQCHHADHDHDEWTARSEECISIAQASNGEVHHNSVSHGTEEYQGGEGINVKNGCSYIYVHHNIVDQARDDGVESTRYCMGVDGWTLETHHIYFYNNIVMNGSWGIQFNSEEGGYTHHIYAWNNIIIHCGHGMMHGGGIGFPRYGGSPGTVDYVYWWNNVIYDCYYGFRGDKEELGTGENYVQNNIIYGSVQADTYFPASNPDDITFDHNLWGETDPRFVNASGEDFHLMSDSPAIDAGFDFSGFFTDDYDGNSRPVDGDNNGSAEFDIGAFEYGGSPSNCTGTCKANPCDAYDDCADGSGTCVTGYCCSGACSLCPNTVCEPPLENCSSCPSDCACVSPQLCCNDQCVTPACSQESDCGSDPCRVYTCNNPGTCSASCSSQDITSCINDDNCCPSGCDEGNDNDCGGLGPVALYRFDEGSGFIASDSSGNGNDGTVYGANWTTGLMGNALEFDGNDYVEANDSESLNLSQTVTITAWINPSSISSWDRIAAKSHTSDTTPYTMYGLLFDDANHIRLEIATSGTQNIVNGLTTIPTNEWTFVAGTYNGSSLKLYVNGSMDNSILHSGSIDTNNMPLSIGRSGFDSNYFNGIIDEVRIYDRALTESEILQLYNNPGGESIPGDLDYDYDVDIFDLQIVTGSFGMTSGFDPRADTIQTGEIDIFDVVFVASRFT